MITPLPHRGEFKLALKNEDGSDRVIQLKFSFKSMARIEERMGYALTKLANDIAQMNIRMRPIVDIIYEGAAEARGDKKEKLIDYDTLADLVVANGIPQVARALMSSVMKILVAGKDEVPEGKEEPVEKTE